MFLAASIVMDLWLYIQLSDIKHLSGPRQIESMLKIMLNQFQFKIINHFQKVCLYCNSERLVEKAGIGHTECHSIYSFLIRYQR